MADMVKAAIAIRLVKKSRESMCRFEIWCGWLNAFYGTHQSFSACLDFVAPAVERGDFFTLRDLSDESRRDPADAGCD